MTLLTAVALTPAMASNNDAPWGWATCSDEAGTAYLLSGGNFPDAATATLGAALDLPARTGAELAEVLFWNIPFSATDLADEILQPHDGSENHLTACYSFVKDTDLAVTATSQRIVTDKVLGTRRTATDCLADEIGRASCRERV